MTNINVLFLAAEADPFIKVGGLGDVAGSLPHAVRQYSSDFDVRLMIPLHNKMRMNDLDLREVAIVEVDRLDKKIPAKILLANYDGVPVYFVDGAPISSAANVYSPDMSVDGEKYTFFSLAALEFIRQSDWKPDIIHANDWHTAPAVHALRQLYIGTPLAQIKTIIGIHNLPFMGGGAAPYLAAYGLYPSSHPNLPDWARQFPLPMGLAAADSIVAVSPTYAHELLTPEFGCGLQDFLRTRADILSGILNGLDMESWNPQMDSALDAQYSAGTLSLRAINKAAIQSNLSLPAIPHIPLLSVVTRMDPQKGVDIILDGLRLVADLPWQAVILGTGISHLEDAVRRLQDEFPDRVRAEIRFDATFSRQLYGGSDVLLMPSRYEPCGLAQMIAMRYGCIPLARATGGLKDTVRPYTDEFNGTGFLFSEATPMAFASALRQSLLVYHDQDRWQHLQLNGMALDFSWTRSAQVYADLYKRLLVS
jgi:starch synthase